MADTMDVLGDTDYALETRAGLAGHLQFLLTQYPYNQWQSHPNLSGLLRFWLAKHQEFNSVCSELSADSQRLLAGLVTPQSFRTNLLPKVRWLLAEFAEHHHIEDHFTFPALRRVEPKLAKGFDMLDADHSILHTNLQTLAQVSNGLLQAQNTKQLAVLGQAYSDVIGQLSANLKRHLIDEEELVIPVFLDRGEQLVFG